MHSRRAAFCPGSINGSCRRASPGSRCSRRQIGNIRAAAVCVGRAGVGPWQEQELRGFLSEFVSRKAPVIPLLLPGAPARPELPIFLQLTTYVDFGVSDPDPMMQLEWGITGVRPEGA